MASGGRASRRRGRIYRCRGGSKRARSEGNGEGICVRGHRITLVGRMRVDANGDVYVPDSVDEESGMVVDAGGVEMADFGAGLGAADGAQMAIVGVPTETIAIGAIGVAEDGFDVVTKGVPADAVEVASDGGATDAVKVVTGVGTSEEMHPKVAARMKKLLAQMDPTFHNVFVSMFKTTRIMRRQATT